MTADKSKIPDFSGFTCTNLMIRLKMLLKNAPTDSVVEIIVRRDQTDMIEIPFSRTGYDVKILKLDNNLFHVTLQKRESGAGS
ncbi:MAG: hypothetical protein NTV68_05920 [Methanomicrobiales archaeon]|nr:hypothetical protein [Methanomicrobiales archaeon]